MRAQRAPQPDGASASSPGGDGCGAQPHWLELTDERERWLFDLDGCLVDSFAATWLRPHGRAALEAVRDRGAEAHLWSAGGADYAARVAARVGIDDLIDGYHTKHRGDDGRWLLPPGMGPEITTCVDDQPDGIPAGARAIAVFPYLGEQPSDRELLAVLDHLGRDGSA